MKTPPIKPDNIPDVGDEWVYAGKEPIKRNSYQDPNIKGLLDNHWLEDSRWEGSLQGIHYAVRINSDIHRAQPWYKPELTLEVGKYYKNRKGDVVGPLEKSGTLMFDGNKNYLENGSYCYIKSINDLIYEATTEEIAKSKMEEGWLWFGKGPLKVKDLIEKSTSKWCEDRNLWEKEGWNGGYIFFYAIKAGTQLARDNGLEPEEPQYRELGPDEVIQRGDEVFYSGYWRKAYGAIGDFAGNCQKARRPIPSYPPPESEWPEKPEPPEGCEWVRMCEDDVSNENRLLTLVNNSNKVKWELTVIYNPEYIQFKAFKKPNDKYKNWPHLTNPAPVIKALMDLVVEYGKRGVDGELLSEQSSEIKRAMELSGFVVNPKTPLRELKSTLKAAESACGDYMCGYRDGLK